MSPSTAGRPSDDKGTTHALLACVALLFTSFPAAAPLASPAHDPAGLQEIHSAPPWRSNLLGAHLCVAGLFIGRVPLVPRRPAPPLARPPQWRT